MALNKQEQIPLSVYVLSHSYEIVDGNEKLKIIGIFYSESLALAAAELLKSKKGFCEHPDGFIIELFEINKTYWDEGFITYKW